MGFGFDSGTLAAVIGCLLGVGILYNWLVGWAERTGRLEPYTSFAVVGGVVITLIGYAIMDPFGALVMMLLFAASGLPMIVGQVCRYTEARRKEMGE